MSEMADIVHKQSLGKVLRPPEKKIENTTGLSFPDTNAENKRQAKHPPSFWPLSCKVFRPQTIEETAEGEIGQGVNLCVGYFADHLPEMAKYVAHPPLKRQRWAK